MSKVPKYIPEDGFTTDEEWAAFFRARRREQMIEKWIIIPITAVILPLAAYVALVVGAAIL